MKNLIHILAMMLLLASCTEEQTPEIPSFKENNTTRSASDIIKLACDASLIILGNEINPSRSSDFEIISLCSSTNLSRNGLEDTVLYIVNIPDNKGFVIITADNKSYPVLGITESGSYSSNSGSGVEALDEYIESLRLSASTTGFLIPDTTNLEFEYEPIYGFGKLGPGTPRLNVAWSGKWPTGEFCPNYNAGCVSVAAAQVMSYFKLPNHIEYNFPESMEYLSEENLNWNQILRHKRDYDFFEPSDEEVALHNENCKGVYSHRTIAAIMREIGFQINANYGYSLGYPNTSAVTAYAVNLIKNWMQLSDEQVVQKNGNLFQLLMNNKNSVALFSQTTHAWVADDAILYKVDGDQSEDDPLKIVVEKLVHYNWGWGGTGNGYFVENEYNTEKGFSYDFEGDLWKYDYSPLNNPNFWLFSK